MRGVVVAVAVLVAGMLKAGEVTGTVTNSQTPLPGTTITLTSMSGDRRSAVSNERGTFRFGGVPNGRYDLRYELAGLETAERTIDVDGDLALPSQELTIGDLSNITIITCGVRTCSDTVPASKFDRPLCIEEDLTTSLIESIERDRSALALLQQRYRTADTYVERNRIGAVLLDHLENDHAIWTELEADAEVIVRFPPVERGELSPEFEAYSQQRNLGPENLRWLSLNALEAICHDKRSRPLLYRALDTADYSLVMVAVAGLAAQRDASALPRIDRALARFSSDEVAGLAAYLEGFESPDAEKLLAKYREE